MQNKYFADKRDLVKWSVLYRLAEIYQAQRILQIAYYRRSAFPDVLIDDLHYSIPQKVLAHFRNLQTVESMGAEIHVTVFMELFHERTGYLESVLSFLAGFQEERCVVFLDPDTGLAPQNPNLNHVLESEAKAIWDVTKSGDVYVFYQHRTNQAGAPWIEPKRHQLEEALRLPEQSIKIAQGPQIAHDVVFFYMQKP